MYHLDHSHTPGLECNSEKSIAINGMLTLLLHHINQGRIFCIVFMYRLLTIVSGWFHLTMSLSPVLLMRLETLSLIKLI